MESRIKSFKGLVFASNAFVSNSTLVSGNSISSFSMSNLPSGVSGSKSVYVSIVFSVTKGLFLLFRLSRFGVELLLSIGCFLFIIRGGRLY